MSNFEKANETIYRVLNPQYGDFAVPTDAVQALADAGLLAEDLPEPYTIEGQGGAHSTAWQPCYTVALLDWSTGAASEVEMPVGNVWVELGGIIGMDTDHSEMHLSTTDARALALALLAAADHAEKGSE